MNCSDCKHSLGLNRGTWIEHVCDFTGAAVPTADLADDKVRCPVGLMLISASEKAIARTVLITAQRRGKLGDLLAAYPADVRALLLAELLTVSNDRPVKGKAKSEACELKEKLIELGAYPEMAVVAE